MTPFRFRLIDSYFFSILKTSNIRNETGIRIQKISHKWKMLPLTVGIVNQNQIVCTDGQTNEANDVVVCFYLTVLLRVYKQWEVHISYTESMSARKYLNFWQNW